MWIPYCQGMFRYTSCNDASCPYNGTIAYRYAREDDHASMFLSILPFFVLLSFRFSAFSFFCYFYSGVPMIVHRYDIVYSIPNISSCPFLSVVYQRHLLKY